MRSYKMFLAIVYLIIFTTPTTSISIENEKSKHDHGNHKQKTERGDHDSIRLKEKTLFLKSIDSSIGNNRKIKKLVIGKIVKHLPLLGKVILNPNKIAKISPRYSGLVISVKKTIGQYVKKGELLAIMEENVGLQKYRLYSPLSGIVINRNLSDGEVIKEGHDAFLIADLNVLWVKLIVRQEYFNNVNNNQNLLIISKYNKKETSKETFGKVLFVSPTIDEHTMTGKVLLAIDNSSGNWHPGESVNGYIPIGENVSSIIIPKKSIITVGKKNGAFIIKDSKVFWKEVSLGISDYINYQVLDGLDLNSKLFMGRIDELKKILLEKLSGDSNHSGH